jgi:hypothetical protein
MRSRALPDDFDMAQALHSPFGNHHGLGTPLASPGSYAPSYSESNMMRPLSIDTLRRGPLDNHISPTGISPAFGGFTFTPPQSATDTLSPVSAHAFRLQLSSARQQPSHLEPLLDARQRPARIRRPTQYPPPHPPRRPHRPEPR